MAKQVELLPGTLNRPIPNAASLGHPQGAHLSEPGARYAALSCLEHEGLLESACSTSGGNRRAKSYRLTAARGKRSRKTAKLEPLCRRRFAAR